jgi:hypothetical protein
LQAQALHSLGASNIFRRWVVLAPSVAFPCLQVVYCAVSAGVLGHTLAGVRGEYTALDVKAGGFLVLAFSHTMAQIRVAYRPAVVLTAYSAGQFERVGCGRAFIVFHELQSGAVLFRLGTLAVGFIATCF